MALDHVASREHGPSVLTCAEARAIIRIPLRAKGVLRAYTLIDLADAEYAERRWWESGTGYAVGRRDGRIVRLHRELLGLSFGDGLQVDHINRNRLDNRRSNLRVTDMQGNAENRGSVPGSTSQYRGVVWAPWAKRWRAQSKMAGKHHHLGYFEREEDAAEAARAFRVAHMPMAVG